MRAMRDRATEAALYAQFRAFFITAEEERRWNLWDDVPWDGASASPSATLTSAVRAAYVEELMLPEAAAVVLYTLRSSRGRAWFVTRWSYEEGKHLLALGEWLVRSGTLSDDELRDWSAQLLDAHEWRLEARDPLGVLNETLLREIEEAERYRALRALADAEGDAALTFLTRRFLADEQAHRAFLRDALVTLARSEPDAVAQAARNAAARSERWGAALLAELDITS